MIYFKFIYKYVLVLIIVLSLSSCVSIHVDSDQDIADKNIEMLATCLEAKESKCVAELFALNIVTSDSNFDASIDDLIEYYNGEFISIDGNIVSTVNDKHNGVEKTIFKQTPDVTTTEGVYRFAIEWYVEDTGDSRNIGIWSLYIIEYDQDVYPNYSYVGDGLWTPGIYIGITLD